MACIYGAQHDVSYRLYFVEKLNQLREEVNITDSSPKYCLVESHKLLQNLLKLLFSAYNIIIVFLTFLVNSGIL
jgi:hypothetical protein